MSYILDALKKAERERRPALLADPPTAGARTPRVGRRWLLLGLVGALVGNAVVLAVVFRQSPPSSPAVSVAASPPAVASSAVTPTAAPRDRPPSASTVASPRGRLADEVTGAARFHRRESLRPPPTAPPLHPSPPAPKPSVTAARPPTVPARPPAGSGGPRPAETTSPEPLDPEAAAGSPGPAVTAAPPSSAPASGGSPAQPAAISRMHLQVIVYSADPAERQVFIDGRKYVEGQRVDDQMVVEAITADGVVLRAGEERYTLRR